MKYLPVAKITMHFRWKFWEPPIDCIGGLVRFGRYYEIVCEGQTTFQTPDQHRVKNGYLYFEY
jgi:hypothetical protein